MSKVVQAIVGIVEIVAGLYFGEWLIGAGVSTLLNVAAQLLQSPYRMPVQPIAINYSGTLEPRRILYGTLKVGGCACIPP